MAGTGGGNPWRGMSNPFPNAAVAHVYDYPPDVLTIETPAVRKARRVVSGYLNATRTPGTGPGAGGRGGSGEHLIGKGAACVIEGDYGTGKTHLAMDLLARAEGARAGAGPDMRVFYQVVPGGTFMSLYTGLMKDHIGLGEMQDRVRECYSDIVADALRDRPFTEGLIDELHRGNVDPERVIDRYGLKEGALRDELRRQLREVTGNEVFGRALMLLLRPELATLAWEWLVGGFPGTVLAERGITRPLATDIEAMDALGVVARLYGRRDRRFVLVIDEMEKLAVDWDHDVTHAQALKRLLEVFRVTGSLLVMCGLPDIFEILPPDPGRVDAVIRPSLLTADDVRWYIGQALASAAGGDGLAPFTRESADYIVYLTSGVARDVLRICYYAFDEAAETGEEITAEVLRQVARYRVPNAGAERARSDIADILAEQGWPADRHRVLGALPGAVADFWIPRGAEGAGCAILVSDSVLEDREARVLAEQAKAVASGDAERAVILVVGGYLPEDRRRLLAAELGAGSLVVYHVRTFGREFARALQAAMDRFAGTRPPRAVQAPGGLELAGALPAPGDSDEIRTLRAETERIARQQDSTLRALRELLRRSESLTGAVAELRAGPGPAPDTRAGLPAEVETLFSRARDSLEAYGDVRGFLEKTFQIAARQPGERFPLTHRLRRPDAFSPIGIAEYLSDLLGGFRSSVQSWLAAVRPGPDREGAPTEGEREWLRGICQTYDSLYGVAQVYKLDPLPDMIDLADDGREPADRPSRSVRREELEAAFSDLGERVHHAALRAAARGGRP